MNTITKFALLVSVVAGVSAADNKVPKRNRMGGNKRLSRGRRNRRHLVGDFTPYADWDPMMERELSAPAGRPFRERELSQRFLIERDLSMRAAPFGRERELSTRTLVEEENPFGRKLRGKRHPEKTADKLLDFFE